MTPVTEPVPPEAPREPFEHTEHDVARPDPYHWMHGDTPALTEYLSAERSFYDSSVAHLHPLVSTLKSEMFSRLAPTEVSARWRRTRYSYYTVHLAGNDYEHIFREIHGFETDLKQISPVGGELDDENRTVQGSEPVLDIGSLADESGYLDLGVTLVSPDEDLLAYSVDTTGDEVYALRFRDLRTGLDLDEVVPRSYYSGAWSADSQWYFYTVHDAGVPAARGVAAPHRHSRHRGRPGAGRAGRAVRAERPGEPVRGGRAGAQREP